MARSQSLWKDLRRGSILFACILLLSLQVKAQGPDPHGSNELVLGKAGSEFIGEDEFMKRFELLPGLYRHRTSRLDEEKLIVMYSLIAEKLLAQEAEARGVDRDSSAVSGMNWLTELLSRDELYREEVAGKVDVTRDELRAGVRNAVRKLLVRYLYFPRRQDADVAARQLEGRTLDQVSFDSTISFLRDTVTIVWGSAEPEVEGAAFALRPGVCSPVVVSSKGYLLLQLLSEEPNRFYAGMQPSVLADRVRDHIRLIKEKARMEEFLRETLPGKRGYAVSSAIKALALAVSAELAPSVSDSLYVLRANARPELERRLRSILSDTCLVAGEKIFSVKEVIEMLVDRDFSTPSPDALKVAGEINALCEVRVQQELLAQEGLRRGLQGRPQVQKELKEWRDAYLAQLMRARIEDSIAVTDADVYKFRELNGNPLPTPRVRIRVLTTSSLEVMRQAMSDVNRGVPFTQVIGTYSSSPEERSKGGLTDWFPITHRPPFGEIAAQMTKGQMYGPIPVQHGLALFQLVDRMDSASSDTSVASSKRQSAAELTRLLRKQALDRFIAGSAARRGFSVFEDRLKGLKVSPVPMMSFRVIGFGGRLFAAPMLPRLFDWINVEVPRPSVAP